MNGVNFSIKPLRYKNIFHGFELEGSHLYMTGDGLVHHNSGKSVLEQNIINHVSHFPDEFQLVGVDCKVVEFNQLRQ